MQILINENWRVTADHYNYILERKNINQKADSKKFGEEYWVSDGFYSSVEDCFSGYLDKKIKESDVKSIKELIQLVNDTRQEIEGLRQELTEAVRV